MDTEKRHHLIVLSFLIMAAPICAYLAQDEQVYYLLVLAAFIASYVPIYGLLKGGDYAETEAIDHLKTALIIWPIRGAIVGGVLWLGSWVLNKIGIELGDSIIIIILCIIYLKIENRKA